MKILYKMKNNMNTKQKAKTIIRNNTKGESNVNVRSHTQITPRWAKLKNMEKKDEIKPIEGWAEAVSRANKAREEKLRTLGILIPEVQEGEYQNVQIADFPVRVKDPSGETRLIQTPVLRAENLLLPVHLTNKPQKVFSTLRVIKVEKNSNGYVNQVLIE